MARITLHLYDCNEFHELVPNLIPKGAYFHEQQNVAKLEFLLNLTNIS